MPHAWWWNHYISKFRLLACPPIALNQRGFILEWGKFCNLRILLTTKCTQSNTFLDLLVNLWHTGYIAWMIWRGMPLLVTRWNVHWPVKWPRVDLWQREREAHWGPIRSLTPTLSERSVSEMDGDRNGPKTVLPSKMIVADHDRTGKWACDLAPLHLRAQTCAYERLRLNVIYYRNFNLNNNVEHSRCI